LDAAVEDLRKRKHLDGDHKIEATDMDAIDGIMDSLRERVKAESS
jgi:hypothetical protein